MKTLIIYDTQYGCTEKIARAIGEGIGGEVKTVKAGEASAFELGAYDMLVVGSPTQGGRQTIPVKEFVDNIPAEVLKNKKAAAFDTRMKGFWVKMFGWAADRIAGDLKGKGAELIAPAEGFLVKSGKGPLVEGEEARAKAWGKTLVKI